ncbi:unnamed protein product, partial [Prorocentrum cordatum]
MRAQGERADPGGYDLASLAALRLGDPAGVPEFVGPVEAAFVAGKGRGLVAARDCEPGELLLVNRPLAVGPAASLLRGTLRALAGCSEEEREAGGRKARARAAAPPGTVQAILDANAHKLDSPGPGAPRPPSEAAGSGLFLLGSLVNHSCRPSAARVFLGDTMFVRAARRLQKGDEITDSYVSVMQPAFERRAALEARFGFRIADDRCLVEDALLPEPVAQPLLARLDGALAADVEQLAWDRVALLGAGAVPAAAEEAAGRLGPGVAWMLCGAFMPAFVGLAVLAEQECLHERAARAYSRCCCFMEELAPHSAYHSEWALAALRAARAASLPLGPFVQYARRVLRCRHGPGALDVAAARGGGLPTAAELAAEPGESPLPPGALACEVTRRPDALHVSVGTGEAESAEEVQVLVSAL